MAFGCMVTSDGSVVERGADMGITYFDTAHSYQQGNNERMVGAALKGKRNSITLSSKTHGLTKQDALNDLDASLKSLQTDHLDIWYLHAKSKPEEVTDDLIDAQQTAKKAGKIRFAGVSTHAGQPVLVPWLAKNPNVDVILSAYNFTPGTRRHRGARAGRRGRQGRGGHQGHGRRLPQPQARRSGLRQAQAGRRLAGGPQVGHAQPQGGPHRRSQHHRQRPA